MTESRGATGTGLLVGVVVAAAVATLYGMDLLRGPASLVVGGLLWVLIPSAASLSRRLLLTGAIGLGGLPLLWWLPALPLGSVGRVGLVAALATGLLAYLAVSGPAARARLLPRVGPNDVVPLGSAVFAAWLFWPFFATTSAPGAVARLVQGFGGDNVAHFDMFAMVREFQTVGHWWPTPADGSVFAYTVYPQHFHALAVAAAEGLHGTASSTTAGEAALFGQGTAVVLAVALVTVAAGVASLAALRARPGLVAVVVAGVISFLFLGLGASSLEHGFPGYVLAVAGVLVAILLAMDEHPTRYAGFAALGAVAVLVAHSWLLLAPLALAAMAVAFVRLPWRRRGDARPAGDVPTYARPDARPAGDVPTAARPAAAWLVMLATAAGVAYAGWLALAATSAAGGAAAALTTSGGVTTPSIPLTAGIGAAVLAVSWSQFTARRAPRMADGTPGPISAANYAAVAAVVVVGLALATGLAAVQLAQAGEFSYFLYKLVNALTIVFAIALALVGVCWVATRSVAVPRASRFGTAPTAVAMSVALVLYSGLQVSGGLVFPGLQFRTGLLSAAASPESGVDRLVSAATAMSSTDCARPFYFATLPGDVSVGQAGQWAMSLSGTWTELGSGVTAALFEVPSGQSIEEIEETVRMLLDADPRRCAVMATETVDRLDPTARARFGDRLISTGP